MSFKYKQSKTFEQRRKDYEEMKIKNPNKIPIICEKDPKCDIIEMKKTKFLIENDLSLPSFSLIIRKKLLLKEENALFFLVNGTKILAGNELMINVYNKYADKDGFLYIIYSSQEVFGHSCIFNLEKK